jgi:hypothetical protein
MTHFHGILKRDLFKRITSLRTFLSAKGVLADAEPHYISSYDRTGGNDDGFQGTYSHLYVDDKGEHVIFEEDGPGCIYNLWFTGSGRNLHWAKIRFYFDNEKTPRIEYEAEEFFGGLHPPFIYPLVTHSFISSGG